MTVDFEKMLQNTLRSIQQGDGGAVTMQSDPPMVSDELRQHADNFVELGDMREHIQREFDDRD